MDDYVDKDIEDLDDLWIKEFDDNDNKYKMYYCENVSFIRSHIIYINSNNEIENVKEEKTILTTPGTLHKNELLTLIKRHTILNETKYSLSTILKININILPEQLKNFLRNNHNDIGSQFIHPIKSIDNIVFEKTISMFHDINDIVIIFKQSTNKNSNTYKHRHLNANKKTKKKNLNK